MTKLASTMKQKFIFPQKTLQKFLIYIPGHIRECDYFKVRSKGRAALGSRTVKGQSFMCKGKENPCGILNWKKARLGLLAKGLEDCMKGNEFLLHSPPAQCVVKSSKGDNEFIYVWTDYSDDEWEMAWRRAIVDVGSMTERIVQWFRRKTLGLELVLL